MFTGIVEKTVRVSSVADAPSFRRIVVAADSADIQSGQSIALNGCCLTVSELSPGEISFDVIQETLDKTNLGLLSAGDEVNFERALRIGDRLDGHFVQGHIDGRAILLDMSDAGADCRLILEAADALAQYLILKGSVALDGVSLTIAAVRGNIFEVALIPTTLRQTTLGRRNVGWPMNLETDIVSKTVISWLQRSQG